MALTTGKTVEMMLETAKETYEHPDSMLDLVTLDTPDPGKLQNASNVIWKTVQQDAPLIEGWDLTGEETDIIEQTYPCILGTPQNDLVKQRADNMRDDSFWKRRAEQSGMRQASKLNSEIAKAIKEQGSLFYRSNDTSGYSFISEAQALMNERQLSNTNGRNFMLNDRDTRKFGEDLAGRQTLQGEPDKVWKTGQLANNIAQFDIFTGSFLPDLVGGADPATTVTGDHSFKPEAGSVNATTKVVTNIDYRTATLVVADSASYNVGDKVTISNSGTTIKALGKGDKTDTGQAMTFSVISKPSSVGLQIFPKPIAADDTALSTVELASANIDTVILDTATVDRLNTDATNKSNLFWAKDSIEVMGGKIPADLFASFDGKKVVHDTMKNGLEMYMLYDGDIIEMTFRFRIFTWFGVTIADPANCGVAVTY